MKVTAYMTVALLLLLLVMLHPEAVQGDCYDDCMKGLSRSIDNHGYCSLKCLLTG